MLLCALIGFIATTVQTKETYEPPSILKASEILPEAFFQSRNYRIHEQVNNDGLVNSFMVTSPYGNFEVVSTIALYKLVGEIEAMAAMTRIEKSDSYLESLKESGIDTTEGLKNLVMNPIDSISGAAKGLSSIFGRAKEAVFQSSPGETEDNKIKQLIGFSRSKREIAYSFHVDVYSTNKALQKQLDSLAWADYAGGITISVATMPFSGPGSALYSATNVTRLLNEAISMTPPSELKIQNREKLAAMNLNPALIDLFINNPNLSPRQQTYIVTAIEMMSSAANREIVLMVALQVSDTDVATAITSMALMQAGYNNHVAKIKQLFQVQRIMGCIDEYGNYILLLPSDYLSWNKKLESVLEVMPKTSDNSEKTKNQLWLLGNVSKRARSELLKRGWVVKAHVAEGIGLSKRGTLQ